MRLLLVERKWKEPASFQMICAGGTTPSQIDENVRCFLCNETFKSKASMMSHRKNKHLGVVRRCSKFIENKCTFKSETCWYLHDEEMETEENGTKEREDKDEEGGVTNQSESVFQKHSVNRKPPIFNLSKKQKVD